MQGALCDIPMAFLLPALAYMRSVPGPLISRQKAPAFLMTAIGSVTFVISIVKIALSVRVGFCHY